MLKFVVVVLAALATIEAVRPEKEYRNAYMSFVKTYKKAYSAAEFGQKYSTFKANYDFVQEWNANPEHTHTVGINKFADLTIEEFSRMYLGTRATVNNVQYVASNADNNTVDWRTKGAVTPIKDQAQCGSCWAFSTTGSAEGAHFFQTGKLVSLSEQNLVDCSVAQGNQGCNGGLMTQAFDYIISNKGIDTEESYPYTATGPNTCVFKSDTIGSQISNYTNVETGSEADLVRKINLGPTSVAIDAGHSSFQLYQSGIYYEPACSPTQLDHGVLAVGYGTTDAEKNNAYYIVKNSWGVLWGIQGYIQMSRNRNNNCGIATMATIPFDHADQ